MNKILSSGLDIEAQYTLPLAYIAGDLPGALRFRLLANRAYHLTTVDGTGVSIDRAGQTGGPVSQQSGVPKWTLTGETSYDLFRVGVRMSY